MALTRICVFSRKAVSMWLAIALITVRVSGKRGAIHGARRTWYSPARSAQAFHGWNGNRPFGRAACPDPEGSIHEALRIESGLAVPRMEPRIALRHDASIRQRVERTGGNFPL